MLQTAMTAKHRSENAKTMVPPSVTGQVDAHQRDENPGDDQAGSDEPTGDAGAPGLGIAGTL